MKLKLKNINWTKVGAVLFIVAGIGLAIGSCFCPLILPAALICFAASHQLFKAKDLSQHNTQDEIDDDAGEDSGCEDCIDSIINKPLMFTSDDTFNFVINEIEENEEDCCYCDDDEPKERIIKKRSRGFH